MNRSAFKSPAVLENRFEMTGGAAVARFDSPR